MVIIISISIIIISIIVIGDDGSYTTDVAVVKGAAPRGLVLSYVIV